MLALASVLIFEPLSAMNVPARCPGGDLYES